MTDTSRDASYPRRRRTVEAFLRERSSRMAGLYGLAADLVEDRRPEGWGYMVGHVGRELMNRLADHLDDVPLEAPASAAPVRPEGIARRLGPALDGDAEQLREVVREILAEVEEGGERVRRRAEALISQGEVAQLDQPETAAWVRAWRDLQRRFASFAHLPAAGSSDLSPEAVERAWHELTGLMAARIAEEPFFESLDDLLAVAATPEPAEAAARAALARLRPGTKPRFYDALDDPAWVGFLRAAGMFSHVPAAVRDGEMVSFPQWPEGLVLLRFAASAPEEVAAAAADVPPTDNSRVVQLLASCAAELPAELAADSGLVARVLGDLRAEPQLLDVAGPVARLAGRLADAGRVGKAMDLLRALLWVEYRTVPSGSEIFPDLQEAAYRHDEYLVDEAVRSILDGLVGAAGQATVKQLGRLLGGSQKRLSYEDSTRWRDQVEGDHAPFGDDVRHLLLDLLRDAAEAVVQAGGEEREWLLSWLEGKDSEIFGRLYLHLLADLGGDVARKVAILGEPTVLFSRGSLPEVHRLLPVAFAEMAQEERSALLETIERGPEPQPWMEGGEVSQEEIEAWQDEWRQRLLSALDHQLGEAERRSLEELRRRRGPVEHPASFAGRNIGWVGPTSPVAGVELARMEHGELLGLLRDFRPERHFAAPSPAGLARALAAAVAGDPSTWDWVADELPAIPPTYVGAWLEGMRQAVRGDAPLPDPERILAAVSWVLDQPADPAAQGEPLEPDVDLYRAQLVGADLLVALLAGDRLDLGHRDALWAVIERLLSAPDPTPEREADTDAEPTQLALTTLRPMGATALLRYLQWLDARLPGGEGPGRVGSSAAPEIESVLSRLLDEDPSAAVRAALASEAYLLAMVDVGLLEGRITDFADPGGSALARVGWQAYVGYGEVYAPLVGLLADAYRRDVGGLATAGPKLDEHRRRLALQVAVIWRDIPDSAPDLPEQYLSVAQDPDRAQMIGVLGRALRPDGAVSYQPDADDLDRHRSLWDARLVAGPGPLELQEFGWWWTSGRLTEGEDIRRLAATLELAGGRLGDIRRGVDLLARVVEADSGLSAASLDVLDVLARRGGATAQSIKPAALERILRVALSDEAQQERAADLVHRFGEQGYLGLRGLLD